MMRVNLRGRMVLSWFLVLVSILVGAGNSSARSIELMFKVAYSDNTPMAEALIRLTGGYIDAHTYTDEHEAVTDDRGICSFRIPSGSYTIVVESRRDGIVPFSEEKVDFSSTTGFEIELQRIYNWDGYPGIWTFEVDPERMSRVFDLEPQKETNASQVEGSAILSVGGSSALRGISIHLDNEFVGDLPIRISVSAGHHTVQVRGYCGHNRYDRDFEWEAKPGKRYSLLLELPGEQWYGREYFMEQ